MEGREGFARVSRRRAGGFAGQEWGAWCREGEGRVGESVVNVGGGVVGCNGRYVKFQ